MFWVNADGNSATENTESGDKNSQKTPQEQHIEMRRDSSEQETESESNDSDWYQASAASVNLSQKISAAPSTTLLEVYQTKEKSEL